MASREARAVAIPFGDDTAAGGGDGLLALEGIFVAAVDAESGGAVVAPPHPLYGGNMESPVVNELAHSCGAAGLASLCFNWRGVGASGGEVSGEVSPALADYAASLTHLAETVPGPLVACGYSFGAAAGLRVGRDHPRVDRAILVAPPLAFLDASELASFAGDLLVIAGEADDFAPAAELERQLERLPGDTPRVSVVTVPDADHFFGTGLTEIGRAARTWLQSTTPADLRSP